MAELTLESRERREDENGIMRDTFLKERVTIKNVKNVRVNKGAFRIEFWKDDDAKRVYNNELDYYAIQRPGVAEYGYLKTLYIRPYTDCSLRASSTDLRFYETI